MATTTFVATQLICDARRGEECKTSLALAADISAAMIRKAALKQR
jgi:hypothetical protein